MADNWGNSFTEGFTKMFSLGQAAKQREEDRELRKIYQQVQMANIAEQIAKRQQERADSVPFSLPERQVTENPYGQYVPPVDMSGAEDMTYEAPTSFERTMPGKVFPFTKKAFGEKPHEFLLWMTPEDRTAAGFAAQKQQDIKPEWQSVTIGGKDYFVDLNKVQEAYAKNPQMFDSFMTPATAQPTGGQSGGSPTSASPETTTGKASPSLPLLFLPFGKSQKEEKLSYHIEKEQIGNQLVQDYRAFTDGQGNTVKREPIGKPYKNTEGITQLRVSAFGTVPTSTPGIAYDRANKKWFETDENGGQRTLTSAEVKARNLQFKEETPTNDIKVMQQAVPSVKQLIGQSRQAIDKAIADMGPLAGRWNDFWTGKVGVANPSFKKMQTDIGLLQTRLMKMHVGARGGEYIMQHFEKMLKDGKDSPENMRAALDEIEQYANEVGQSIVTPSGNNPPTPTPAGGTAPKSPGINVDVNAIRAELARRKGNAR